MPDSVAPIRSAAPPAPAAPGTDPVMKVARELEGVFLSEMLKAAKFGEARDAFGGGIGEEQFSSLLRDMHARKMAERGGIGLAEAIYRSLSGGSHGS